QVQLVETGGGVVFPEGYNFTIYEIHWIRQTPGKEQKPDQGLEWLVHYHKSSRNYYSPTIQGRFVASKDSSNFYLQMSNLKAEDAAVYYCVRTFNHAGRMTTETSSDSAGSSAL
uniref:Immunoglobulin V-set domain-containing protein n=1 Tax=Pseudonaja textilis TaxID=8673 RepID=A0A670Z233_PSETE